MDWLRDKKEGPCGKHGNLELKTGIKTEQHGPQVVLHSHPKPSLMESDPFLIELVLAVLMYEAVK